MADIKTRDAVKGTIKTIDKAAVASERMKSAYAKTKEKAEEGYYANEGSATEYAADKISYASDWVKDEGIHQFNKQGQKGVKATKDNIVKAKDKMADFKQKRAAKAAEQKSARSVSEQYGLQIHRGATGRSPVSDASVHTIKTSADTKRTIKQSCQKRRKNRQGSGKRLCKNNRKKRKNSTGYFQSGH